jgi:hypothetical protein
MEPQDKRLVKTILLVVGVVIGLILMAAFVDSSNLLNKGLFSLKTPPCTSGKCTQCYGLEIRGVCLGVMKLTTKVEESASSNPEVAVTSPQLNQLVKSPIKIAGKARGGWYFEGSFPIKLIDEDGSVIGNTTAKATSNWQTTDFVPFTASLNFSPIHPKGSANLVMQKDNPSGLPTNEMQVLLPVSY